MGTADLKIRAMTSRNRMAGRSDRMNRLKSLHIRDQDRTKPQPTMDNNNATTSEITEEDRMTGEMIYGSTDPGLYRAAEKGNIDGFIDAMERVSSEKQLPLSTIIAERSNNGNTYLHIAAASGNQDLVGFIADYFPMLRNTTNVEGNTPLHLAAMSYHPKAAEIAHLLCELSYEEIWRMNAKGNTPLLESASQKHGLTAVSKYLLDTNLESAYYVNKKGKSALYRFVEEGDVEKVRTILKYIGWSYLNNAKIEEQLLKGRSLVHAAISKRNLVMLQELSNTGHLLYLFKDENGQDPVQYASSKGFLEGVSYLLDVLGSIPIQINAGSVTQEFPQCITRDDPSCSIVGMADLEVQGVRQSANWDRRYERIKNLLELSPIQNGPEQSTTHQFMNLELYRAVKRGDVDEFISALEKFSKEESSPLPIIFNQLTPLRNTFLHVAVKCGFEDLTWLISYHFPNLLNRRNGNGDTALHLASREGRLHLVDILVKFRNHQLRKMEYVSFDIEKNEAIQIDQITLRVEMNRSGNTPLYEALISYKGEVVNYLMKENVEEAYFVNKEGKSALYVAVRKGNVNLVKTILSTASSTIDQVILDAELTKGTSLIHAAIWDRNAEILRELAEKKPMLLQVKDTMERDPVEFAAWTGFFDGLNVLHDEFRMQGTDIWKSMKWKERHERLKKLQGKRSDAQSMPSSLQAGRRLMDLKLNEAAKEGDIDGFISALEKYKEETKLPLHAISDQRTHSGNTLLHVAASFGNKDLSMFIVSYFRHLLKSVNRKYDSAIHMAARNGHLGVVDFLVKFRNDFIQMDSHKHEEEMVVNKEWNTPLHEAMVNNHEAVTEYLINANKEEAFRVNKNEESVLYLAVESGNINFVKTILANVSCIRQKVQDGVIKGKSLMHAAIKKRNIAILKEIANSMAVLINVKDKDGKNALHYASSIGYLEGVSYLIDELKLDTTEVDRYGFFPVLLASKYGHVGVLKKLLQYCPDAREFVNREGQNIFHVAAVFGKNNIIQYILKTPGLELLINEKDDRGNTALHLATINWHPKVASSLTWDKRVNLNVVNRDGMTALDITEERLQTVAPYRQRLTWMALKSAGVPSTKHGKTVLSANRLKSEEDESDNMDYSKDRVNTLLLVATLVATVTFAAGFTMPGGYNNNGPDEGIATFLGKMKFQIFVICNTMAMYSAMMVAVTLVWAQLGDLNLVLNALRLAIPLLGISLTNMSLAFMVSVFLVVSKLPWLANVVLVTGIIALASLLTLFVPLNLPCSSNIPILRYLTYYPFCLLMLASGNYSDPDVEDDRFL